MTKEDLRKIIVKARNIAIDDCEREGGIANKTAYEVLNKLYLALTV